MSKNALYYMSPNIMAEPLPFKRLSLLFHKIYIRDKILSPEVLKYNKDEHFELHGDFWKGVFTNLKEIEYLEKIDIVSTYDANYTYGINELERQELTKILRQTSPEYKKVRKEGISETDSNSFNLRDKFFAESNDISARIDALVLAGRYDIECLPILTSINSFKQQGKKENVYQFLLKKIPEPNESTPWEHVIEFRKDDEVRNKYLALINWINKVSASSSSISDIKDEYEYLYNDYMRHFRLHKMKHRNKTIGIIVTVGDNITSSLWKGKFFSALNGLLDISAAKINLLEQEGMLPGKEVAYIYQANKKFTKL